jgi:hypothetical protein
MVLESQYWKEDLGETIKVSKRRCERRRWPEPSSAPVEQELMLGLYGVRKLLESNSFHIHFGPAAAHSNQVRGWPKTDRLAYPPLDPRFAGCLP